MSDNIEFEGKILDIKVEEIQKNLTALGATKKADHTFRRYVLNTIPATPSKWIRLRTNGDETTFTVKEILNDSVEGTKEWEVSISDFNTMLTILQKSGLEPKGYQENRREEYILDGATICIDYWPQIPPYLEIEGSSKQMVEAVTEKLGFNASNLTGANTTKVYAHYGIDLSTKKDLKFD